MKTISKLALLSALALTFASSAHAGGINFGISIGIGGGHHHRNHGHNAPPIVVTAPIIVAPPCPPVVCVPAPEPCINVVIEEQVWVDGPVYGWVYDSHSRRNVWRCVNPRGGYRSTPHTYRARWNAGRGCYTYNDHRGNRRDYRR